MSDGEGEQEEAGGAEVREAGEAGRLRYHTINIEPMKTVLRTEGDIESNGLKRALHICRGHFVHRRIPNDVIYWRESHVRGSAKEGVVISDYAVNPPK